MFGCKCVIECIPRVLCASVVIQETFQFPKISFEKFSQCAQVDSCVSWLYDRFPCLYLDGLVLDPVADGNFIHPAREPPVIMCHCFSGLAKLAREPADQCLAGTMVLESEPTLDVLVLDPWIKIRREIKVPVAYAQWLLDTDCVKYIRESTLFHDI